MQLAISSHVTNLNAFSGGQDPQNYTFVQQSDIDGIVNPLEQQLTTTAQNNVKEQKKAGEQYVNPSNSVQCTPNVVSNQQAGDKASSVTSTVKVTCTAEVYDQQAAETMAVTQYKNDSTINPGPGFALSGTVTAHLTQATVVDNKGTVSLLVDAQGTWVYQITSTQEKELAQHIKGESKQDARRLPATTIGSERLCHPVLFGQCAADRSQSDQFRHQCARDIVKPNSWFFTCLFGWNVNCHPDAG